MKSIFLTAILLISAALGLKMSSTQRIKKMRFMIISVAFTQKQQQFTKRRSVKSERVKAQLNQLPSSYVFTVKDVVNHQTSRKIKRNQCKYYLKQDCTLGNYKKGVLLPNQYSGYSCIYLIVHMPVIKNIEIIKILAKMIPPKSQTFLLI